jgi:L-fuconolactonase
MRAVIDHGMKPEIRADGFDSWAAGMAAIADKTPVLCKLSGLATEAKADWDVATLRPYAEHIINSFGPARVMWGSDWPVVNLAGGYARWREAAEEVVGTGPDCARIFGGTAAEFYRIS